jgi:hypothetical protein
MKSRLFTGSKEDEMELKDMIEKMNNERIKKEATASRKTKKSTDMLTNAVQEARKRKQEMFKK